MGTIQRCGVLSVAAVTVAALALPAAGQGAVGALAPVSLSSFTSGSRGLDGAQTVAISPDGTNAYVVSGGSLSSDDSGIAVFSRNPATGALTQLAGAAGCVTATGLDGVPIGSMTCAAGNGVQDATAVSVSPDGKFVYVGSGNEDAIGIFARNPATGALTQVGCIGDATNPLCAGQPSFGRPVGIVISTNGHFLYVARSGADAVSVFSRDLVTGALTPVQCVQYEPNGTALLAGCTVARAMSGPSALVLSADGHQLYVAASSGGVTDSNGALVRFDVNAVTGVLTQPAGATGCIDETGTDDTTVGGTVCGIGRALLGANSIATSRDGKSIYIAAQGSSPPVGDAVGAVDLFARNTTTGDPSQLPGTAGCLSVDGSNGHTFPSPGTCSAARALRGPTSVAVSPDDLNVYVASSGSDGSLAVFLRDASSGAMTQVAGSGGCLSSDGGDSSALTCAQTAGLRGAGGLAVATGTASPTCSNVYVEGADPGTVVAFAREPDCAVPAPARPAVVTGGASKLSLHGAKLSGTVNAQASSTTYRFDFGPTTAYGAQTLPGNAGAGSTPSNVTVSIAGLQQGARYHYRIEATNANGTTVGVDRTFTTPLPGKPHPRSLSVGVKPHHPGSPPFQLTVSGRLGLPHGVSKSAGCKGSVRVAVKSGHKTLATSKVGISSRCSYQAKLSVPSGKARGSVDVVASFLANGALAAASAHRSVKYG